MFQQFYAARCNTFFSNISQRFFPALLLAVLSSTIVCAQTFHLVKDINTNTNSNPGNTNSNIGHFASKDLFAVLNGVSYFAADDGTNGRGLWRTDGTPAGTYQVKAGVNPSNIIVANGQLFFIGKGDIGIWKSNGTEIGTAPLLINLPAGLNTFVPDVLTSMNNTVFFAVTNATAQLWKTDGTTAGTQLVKDFGTGIDAYFGLTNFSAIKNKLYFAAFNSNPVYTSRLWVTDGSATGTYIISTKIAAPAQMIPASSNTKDSLIYFSGSDDEFGERSIYITEGKAGIANLAPGFTGVIPAFSFYTTDLISIDGALYFSGGTSTSTQSAGLYRYTVATGTQPVKTFSTNTITGSVSYVQDLAEVNGKLLFSLYDAPGKKSQLWRTDGITGGLVLLRDNFRAYNFSTADGQSYFWGSDGGLWKTDGNTLNIVISKAINFPTGIFTPGKLNNLNNKFLFANADSTHGNELWQCDKTPGGTSLLKDINLTVSASANPQGLIAFDNKIFFAAKNDNSFNSLLLWKSDGTSAGSSLISDSIYGYYFRNFKSFGKQVYFWGTTRTGRQGIFKSDGTSAGTIFIKDFTDKPMSVNGITITNNLVYFYLYNSVTKLCELWRTDGTAANTYAIKENFPLTFEIENAVAAGNRLYFQISNTLWTTDGTVSGTQVLKSEMASSSMAAHNGSLYFNASNGVKNVLWKTTGTSANTSIVSSKISDAKNFISANNSLFFLGTNASDTKGQELYKTTGTEEGTVLVKDINAGEQSTSTFIPTNINDTVYFFTQRNSTDYAIELWKTNGTENGTNLITKVGNCGCIFPTNQLACNGKLFFLIDNLLWESDGTVAGTHETSDLVLADLSSSNSLSDLTSSGNQLFFSASSAKYGTELYAGTITSITYISAANGNWNNPATWTGSAVPPTGAGVIIRHNVTSNINTTCSSLKVEKPGSLNVIAGVTITLLRR